MVPLAALSISVPLLSKGAVGVAGMPVVRFTTPPAGIERRAVGGGIGVGGAGLDGIVIGVGVVDERNVADAEAGPHHRLIGHAVGSAETRSKVPVVGLHAEVGGIAVDPGLHELSCWQGCS